MKSINLVINKDKFDPTNTKVLWTTKTVDRQLDFAFIRKGNSSIINIFKNTFGRQIKTWIGGSESRRFYIWTFRIEDSLLYAFVHNVQGVGWEYPEKINKSHLDTIHKEAYRILSNNVKGK